MLKFLDIHGVGPAKNLGYIEFNPRLNFITGDNGLGKSFLLDIAWWALTRTWARGVVALPEDSVQNAFIASAFTRVTDGSNAENRIKSDFQKEKQAWSVPAGRPPIPGVVIYAGVDGSFSCWDPARNYWTDDRAGGIKRPKSFDFSPADIWDGLKGENHIQYCNGLIHDWVLWQRGNDPVFADLVKVLEVLSPSMDEPLAPGNPVRLGLDVKEQPSLRMAYGDVALVHASAAMRRVVSIAYLLVWIWKEHQLAAAKLGLAPAKEIIFLLDEIECHLHPKWQRKIVPAILKVMKALTGNNVPIQLIAATHSPLVLASIEPFFDEELDSVFTLHLHADQAVIEKEKWAPQGDAVNWLVSDAFGLRQARSVEAEQAIEAAETWMRGDLQELPANLQTQDQIHTALLNSLPGGDHFWPRWIVKTTSQF